MKSDKKKSIAREFVDYLETLEDVADSRLVQAIISGIGTCAASEPDILAEMIKIYDEEYNKETIR